MVGVEEGREFRFRGYLYSQESTFSLVILSLTASLLLHMPATAPVHLWLILHAFRPGREKHEKAQKFEKAKPDIIMASSGVGRLAHN